MLCVLLGHFNSWTGCFDKNWIKGQSHWFYNMYYWRNWWHYWTIPISNLLALFVQRLHILFQSCNGWTGCRTFKGHRLRLRRNCRVLVGLQEELLLLGDEYQASSWTPYHWMHHWGRSCSPGKQLKFIFPPHWIFFWYSRFSIQSHASLRLFSKMKRLGPVPVVVFYLILELGLESNKKAQSYSAR